MEIAAICLAVVEPLLAIKRKAAEELDGVAPAALALREQIPFGNDKHGIKPCFRAHAAAVSAERNALSVRRVDAILLTSRVGVLRRALNDADTDRLGNHAVGLDSRKRVAFWRAMRFKAAIEPSVCLAPVAVSDADRLRSAHIAPSAICFDVPKHIAYPRVCACRGTQGVCFFVPANAALQNVPKQNAPILRLADAGYVCPIEPLSVLCRHQRGVDKDRFDVQLLCDLLPDGGRHGLVIFVQEEIGAIFVPRDQVVFEQLPAQALRLCLTVSRLRDAPMSARAASNQ